MHNASEIYREQFIFINNYIATSRQVLHNLWCAIKQSLRTLYTTEWKKVLPLRREDNSSNLPMGCDDNNTTTTLPKYCVQLK